jgi:hypothetical protein
MLFTWLQACQPFMIPTPSSIAGCKGWKITGHFWHHRFDLQSSK